jgi:hypothetical protein
MPAPHADHDKSHRRLHHFVGRVRRAVGRITGDRRVEAVGEAEVRAERPPDVADIRQAEQDVKRHYVDHEG